jgi:hypothetical protein
MPQIRELEIKCDEDAEKVHEFAKENAMYLSKNGAKVVTAIMQNDLDTAIVGMSFMCAEAYTSGVVDGLERAKNGKQKA